MLFTAATAISLLIIAIITFFACANYFTNKSHASFKTEDVISAVENVLGLDNCGDHDEWHLFMSHAIDDPYLESIRKRCHQIARQGAQLDWDIQSEKSRREIMKILDELRAR